MRLFPERLNNGQAPTKYGIAVEVKDETALVRLLNELLSNNEPDVFADVSVLLSSSTDETEKENLIKARLGQGHFCELLLDDFEGVCAVSGVSLPEALRASHIKPWRLSSNKERLDPNTGLLLGVAYDALFDRYLISFSDDGKILISKSLLQDQLDKLGINRSAKLTSLNADRLKYLEHHRKEFSGRESKTLST